ncbi:PfaD family polyunsaturated fatty acid/polyketide biosynthesis protein [Pseudonocardia xinjiangensis]|uniref:PfaD family polyunsaturated fatty acid/polyketide biosynthesis protein n=1 Tax=Pseudonocardia xinjiangensis TaxID=75289 RepID=UPI0028A8B857|nr:PfaD family polyunsaturated fatty acid/polyketide biosynthesis protein [Pseudonocardia xinjiangensis]
MVTPTVLDIAALSRDDRLARTPDAAYGVLADLDQPVYVIRDATGLGLTGDGGVARRTGSVVLAAVPPLPPRQLGAAGFRHDHGVEVAYQAGAMAHGLASPEMVATLARGGVLGSFGAAGLVAAKVDAGLARIAREAAGRPFACNLIHSPSEPAMERSTVDLCLRHGVRCVEASAFLELTPEVVRYRALGLTAGPDGRPRIGHRVIAKVSRAEVAELFLRPAPEPLLRGLVEGRRITAEQARLAARVPMADDVTAEADSGGHTDRRPMPVLLGEILRVRDAVCVEHGYPVRVGAAGGIGTPTAAAAAFAMGADYVVTGSVNQACVESGQSAAVKELLGAAGVTDCDMAPSSDMFELGVDVQVLRRGTMFPARARRLFELYRRHDGIEDIPADERANLERTVFRRGLDEVWADTVAYFAERDPDQIARAEGHPKRRMALVFRWYLGLSSGWAAAGVPDRVADYQVWCGAAMGACNAWLRGTPLEPVQRRTVTALAHHIMRGAAYQSRLAALRSSGVSLPARCSTYRPSEEGPR